MFPSVGVYPLPPVMFALSTFAAIPLRNSVTAPCAPPSADVTIVLTVPVAAALALVGSALSVFVYVNVVALGTLKTRPFSLNVSSVVFKICTVLPTCKLCAALVVTVATLLLRSANVKLHVSSVVNV